VSQVVVAPLLAALVTAILALALRSAPSVQRAASVLGGVGYLAAVALLVRAVLRDGTLVYQLSGWPAPYGITLVADALALVFLGLAAVVSLAALVASTRSIGRYGQRLSYHPLYHFMVVGITGSFLTADLFNLFVWFEVMLMSSYVLVVFYSGPEHTRAALHYAFLNLVGSAVMLLAIGGIYATTGTLNMADVARRLAEPAAWGIEGAVPTVLGLSAVLFAVFALKAGIVPFQFWVPDAYRAAPAPVAAMLAAVVKKVGVYAVIRLYFTVFAAARLEASVAGFEVGGFLDFFAPVLLAMAAGSIVVGGLGAAGRTDLDGLLAYSSIGQVGFIVLPLGLAALVTDPGLRELGVVAAVVYSVNHGLAKAALFLVSGAVEDAAGSVEFEAFGGLTERAPVLSGAFLVGALALVGIPPLSGFFGKLLVFDVAARTSGPALAVALVGAVLTVAYLTLAWSRGFWGDPVAASPVQRSLVVAPAVLALAIVALGVGFDPFVTVATEAARAALDTTAYVDAVDPTVRTGAETLARGPVVGVVA